jgi:hypothetical protein
VVGHAEKQITRTCGRPYTCFKLAPPNSISNKLARTRSENGKAISLSIIAEKSELCFVLSTRWLSYNDRVTPVAIVLSQDPFFSGVKLSKWPIICSPKILKASSSLAKTVPKTLFPNVYYQKSYC